MKFRLLGPLSQAYNIIVHMRGLLSKIAEFIKLMGRIILIDNYIR